MKPRLTFLITLATVTLMVGGLWLVRGESLGSEPMTDSGQAGANQGRERKRDAAKPKPGDPQPAERSLAFDVDRNDYKVASNYILEITDPAGSVTTHDLKKPRRRKGSIMVPLPVLAPGTYQLVVVAAGTAGKSRSAPLEVEIR